MKKHFEQVDWITNTNIYEVNIRQYTSEGTFSAFARHLPRLKEMGVKILWLMPVTPISVEQRQGTLGSYYACSSYTEINPEFGSIADFKSLVRAAHKHDMKLIIDWVANHTGWDHPWATEHPDWYAKDEDGNFTERNGWHDVIDLNFQSLQMRQVLIDAMKFWVKECDIDGFRCDMAHLVPLDFWKDARKKCDALKPLCWLAECEVVDYHEAFDISYAWEWMHITEKMMKGFASLGHLIDVIEKYKQYPAGAKKLFFTSNHDENSWNGTDIEKYGRASKTFAVFTCLWSGVPLVYSGQEVPNTKRLKFFDKDEIQWTEKPSLHDFYRTLLELRMNHKAMQSSGKLHYMSNPLSDKILSFMWQNGDAKIIVLLNFSQQDKLYFSINLAGLAGKYVNLFSGIEHELKDQQHFEMQGWEYFVYLTKD